jgi:hypothetical protein
MPITNVIKPKNQPYAHTYPLASQPSSLLSSLPSSSIPPPHPHPNHLPIPLLSHPIQPHLYPHLPQPQIQAAHSYSKGRLEDAPLEPAKRPRPGDTYIQMHVVPVCIVDVDSIVYIPPTKPGGKKKSSRCPCSRPSPDP